MIYRKWCCPGTSTDTWKAQTVTLGSIAPKFRVMFEGVRGESYDGDVAIDDIHFEKCGDGESLKITFFQSMGNFGLHEYQFRIQKEI